MNLVDCVSLKCSLATNVTALEDSQVLNHCTRPAAIQASVGKESLEKICPAQCVSNFPTVI